MYCRISMCLFALLQSKSGKGVYLATHVADSLSDWPASLELQSTIQEQVDCFILSEDGCLCGHQCS